MSFQWRYYQKQAVDAVFDRWGAGDRGTGCFIATGLGKTAIAAMVAKRCVEESGRVLFLAHREDLLDGAFAAFKRELHAMQILFELNVDRVWTSDIATGKPDAVVASVQSMHRRLEKYPSDFFTHVIVDESHRAAAQTYLKIVHHFPDARLLYLTATPHRSDGKALSGYTYDEDAKPTAAQRALEAICCQSVAFEFDRQAATDDGWLVEPIPRIVKVDVDWSTLKLKGGDYKPEDVERIMREDESILKVADGLNALVKDKCGVVFMPGVDSAHGLAHRLQTKFGIDAVAIDGKTETNLRKEIIKRAKNGSLQCMVNVGIAVEGFDSVHWQYVADCQPTRHYGRYIQKLGRGVRPADGEMFNGIGGREHRQQRLAAIAASVKPRWEMIDFCGNMGNMPKPLNCKEVLIGELPHKSYGGQPKPKDDDVRRVAMKHPDLSVQEARQRASDELYMHQLLMVPRLEADVECSVDVHEFEDMFSIPFVWTQKGGPRQYKTPPPGKEATEKQLAAVRRVHYAKHGKAPDPEWLRSLSKGGAGNYLKRMMEGAKA
jgi:superfamily II DNA or RNA helicase